MNWPLESAGSAGENVRTVQYLLNAEGATLSVDGVFGALTDAAVRAFQSGQGLVVDGIVGNQTWPALIIEVASGASGDAVRAVQSQIHARSGWLTVDGVFGSETESAARFFQGDIGLTVDGIVGPDTWNALVGDYLKSQGGSAAATAVFDAWMHNDKAGAALNATPQAFSALFTRTWSAADGWTFDQCNAGAGHFYCTWSRTGGTLVLEGNDNTGAPFYFVENVTFQP